MAFSLNRAQVIGNVTRDPEIRQTSGGQAVAIFAVATNSSWTDKEGQKQEKSEFHNIVVWGKLAEIAGQYVKKGRKLYVEGRMQTRDWTGEDGVKRYRTEIIADNFILLDRADGKGMEGAIYSEAGPAMERNTNSSALRSTQTANANANVNEEEMSLDDLPF